MKEKTKLEEVFSLFYSYDNSRPVMLNPFVVGDKTYATNGHILISCDSDKLDFEYENNEKPLDISKVVLEQNTYELINIDKVDWESLKTEDETIGNGEDVTCGHCDGYGSCEESIRYKNKSYNLEYECPVCEGSGLEEEEKFIPTGNKTFPAFKIVKFKDTYFYIEKFYVLKKVKDLLGCDVELLHYNLNSPHKPVLFRIGIVEIIIMPMMLGGSDDIIVEIG
jgi:excinuclease UvrABC ATPase subunit